MNRSASPLRLVLQSVICCVMVLIANGRSEAQQIVLQGVVRNQDGRPVPGAVVAIGTVSTTTGTNGGFRLPIAMSTEPQADILRVTSIGYRPWKQAIDLAAGPIAIDVELTTVPIPLAELLVTGTAGERTRRAQAADVAVIDVPRVLSEFPVTSLYDLLQARVPGLSVVPSSGSAGSASRLQVRGGGTIMLSNEPLVFIDGIRADNRILDSAASGGQAESRLADLSLLDIERIEVARGPAAATFYGADASTGVIHIITRRPSAEQSGLRQRVTLGFGVVDPAWSPPDNYALCADGEIADDSPTVLCRGREPGAVIKDNPLMRNGLLRTGITNTVAWSGTGGHVVPYRLSFSSFRESGTLPGNEFGRQAIRIGLDHSRENGLSIRSDLALIFSTTELPQNHDNPTGILAGALLGSPRTIGTTRDGWFGATDDALIGVESSDVVTRAIPSVTINFRTGGRISHRLTAGADVAQSRAMIFYPPNDKGWYGGGFDSGFVMQDLNRHDLVTLDYLADLRLDARNRPVSAIASVGAQWVERRQDYTRSTGGSLSADGGHAANDAETRATSRKKTRERAVGALGQIQIDWKRLLYLQGGARMDRNSSFGSRAPAFVLPRAGVSLMVSEVPFWNGLASAVPVMRLRVAWGTTGRSPNAGSEVPTFGTASYVLPDGQIGEGVKALRSGNDRLLPERATEIEAGFDATMIGDRVTLSVNWFRKTTRNMLLIRALPPSYGFPIDPLDNIGSIRNSGLEANVDVQLVQGGGITWSGAITVATLHNVLLDLAESSVPRALFSDFIEGRPLGAFRSRQVLRVDAENRVAVVTDTAEYIGSGMPTFEAGLETDVTIARRLRLHTQFHARAGHRLLNATNLLRERVYSSAAARVLMHDLPEVESLTRFGPYVTASGAPVAASEVTAPYVESASFIRWREISLTWDAGGLPPVRSGRGSSITIGVENVALWTRYSGDPEVDTMVALQDKAQYSRYDFGTMPHPRRWFVRLELQL